MGIGLVTATPGHCKYVTGEFMTANPTQTKGTITGVLYLHSTPSRFNLEIARALRLESEKDLLDLDITVDVFRSIKNKTPVYRVRYTISAPRGQIATGPAGTSTLDWLFSWFRSSGSVS
jgi:hypothetical protein